MRLTLELWGHVLDVTIGPAIEDDGIADLGSVDAHVELAQQEPAHVMGFTRTST